MWRICAKVLWPIIASGILLTGCASAPSAPVAPPSAEAAAPAPAIPAQAQQQFDQALALMSAGQHEQAAKQLQALSAAYPDYPGPLLNLGILQLKANRYAEAEQSFKAALQRDGKSVVAYNYLGIVYRNLGRFKEAESAYKQALSIDDNYALAHLNLGVLCDLYLQQPERALAEFQRYLELSSTPEPQVSNWIKELQRRAGNGNKSNASGASAAQRQVIEVHS